MVITRMWNVSGSSSLELKDELLPLPFGARCANRASTLENGEGRKNNIEGEHNENNHLSKQLRNC